MELEDEVLKGGGQLKKHLDLIVSFAAEMTGKEVTRLAKHPKVRWISADAPTFRLDPRLPEQLSAAIGTIACGRLRYCAA